MRRQLGLLRSLNEGALRLQADAAAPHGQRLVQVAPAAPPLTARLLVVDPDPAAFEARRTMLGGQGYELAHAVDAAAARRLLAADDFDLVMLETELPEGDGLALCRELAQAGAVRILIHSRRDQAIDRVAGLEFGADDYIDKACHPVEVLARVRALLRRAGPAAGDRAEGDLYRFDGWRFDRATGLLLTPDGRSAALAVSEQALLRLFLGQPRQLLRRAEIEREIFGEGRAVSPRVIDVRVVRLRRALEGCRKGGGDLIRTIRGGGYLFSATVTRA